MNRNKQKKNLSQFGLLDINMEDDEPLDLSDDDIDLEAELAAITGESKHPKRKAPQVPAANLDMMIAESLKDVPSDDDSVDENDPDLLSELNELTMDDSEAPAPPPRAMRAAPAPPGAPNRMVQLLQDRISNYMQAESSAKANNESSRARRFARGLKTLNDLLKQAKAGKHIKEEDIPPPVSTGKKSDPSSDPPMAPAPVFHEQPVNIPKSPVTIPESPVKVPESPVKVPESPTKPEDSLPKPSATASAPIPSSNDTSMDPGKQEGLQMILRRKEEFKAAALASKHAGNKILALEYMKVSKQFDLVVEAYKAGQEMDLNELPTCESIAAAFKPQKEENAVQESGPDPSPAPVAAVDNSGLITASTVEEALRQRLAVFQEQETKAKESNNSSKQRRMGRIVKQYQDALKAHLAGRQIPVDELPTPPGYAPIPVGGGSKTAPKPSPAASVPTATTPNASPAPPPRVTRADKQLAYLLMRQKEFKDAAIRAKKQGDITQAKEYLRAAKGFDSVIEAAEGGLAVDLKSLPLPPQKNQQIENTFDIVSASDCGPAADPSSLEISCDDGDVLSKVHQQLTHQLRLCLDNRDHYRAMGNIAESNRFEHTAMSVKQDLDVINVAKRVRQDPPKFHYETRKFSVIQCNTDLNENDLELTIVRGISYTVANPKEIDTYVKFEFPYPQEAPISDRTCTVKDTNSPDYNAVFPLTIHRSQRPCLRVFKRHGIKFEVYSRGGWFSKDALLGTVNVKLAPLETLVTLHEAYPLMDGRRPAGGSLEIKLRVRTPLLQPQLVNSTHRWLVLDV